jgi:hypothetical protein
MNLQLTMASDLVEPERPGLFNSPRAMFSHDRVYRYLLTRTWGYGSGMVQVIGLNCSTATATEDDPTVRRCIGFGKRWGFAGLLMTNLFGWRSPHPEAMKAAEDPVGPATDSYLRWAAAYADLIVAAWGVHGSYRGRDQEVLRLLSEQQIHHLGLTREGHPRHPLYLAGSTQPQIWKPGGTK